MFLADISFLAVRVSLCLFRWLPSRVLISPGAPCHKTITRFKSTQKAISPVEVSACESVTAPHLMSLSSINHCTIPSRTAYISGELLAPTSTLILQRVKETTDS